MNELEIGERMGIGQTAAQLFDDVDRDVDGKRDLLLRAPVPDCTEVAAFDEGHRQEQLALDLPAATLAALDIMRLSSPGGAILSAVIFNALIIIALVPLALRGVTYRPVGAEALLRRNALIYGLGGLVAPFAGIKLIDLLLHALGLV